MQLRNSGGPWTIYVCPGCGTANVHAMTCSMFPGEPVVHGDRVVVVPRAAAEQLARAFSEAVMTLHGPALKPALDALREFRAAYPVSAPANPPQRQQPDDPNIDLDLTNKAFGV